MRFRVSSPPSSHYPNCFPWWQGTRTSLGLPALPTRVESSTPLCWRKPFSARAWALPIKIRGERAYPLAVDRFGSGPSLVPYSSCRCLGLALHVKSGGACAGAMS